MPHLAHLRTLPCIALLTTAAALAQPLALPAFSALPVGPVAAPWRSAGLPGQKMARTQFEISTLEGRNVLRVAANASYGNLVIDMRGQRVGPDAMLRWSWMLDTGLSASDLGTKAGDDVALKVCALFDLPLDGLGLGERTKMRLARSLAGEPLPAATLCYVWDRLLPVASLVPNAFSPRVRYLVVTSGAPRPGQWLTIERNLAADFLRAFGHESSSVPPLLALAVGADADNTGGRSVGFVGDITLAP